MERIAEFEKVSFLEYQKAMNKTYGESDSPEEQRAQYEAIPLPRRATAGSAGYDIHLPTTLKLEPGQEGTIPTGLRVRMKEGWFLGVLPRSGLGFRYGLRLNNTMGIIDSDYYHSDNEGHLFIKVTNGGNVPLELAALDRFAQGIFIPFGITESDEATETRNGGFGSTGTQGKGTTSHV